MKYYIMTVKMKQDVFLLHVFIVIPGSRDAG